MKSLEMQLQETNGTQQFVCFASITTNELEGVFNLTGDLTKKLARCCVFANSIEGIAHQSRRKDPDKIISIIKNTQLCCDSLDSVVSGNSSELFTESFVKEMHRQLLDEDNVDVTHDMIDDHFAVVIPMGIYRAVPCYAMHESYETHFCASNQIDKEMKWFFAQVHRILSTSQDLDPFRACAWIQHFPFSASIPLPMGMDALRG
jgi:hypothetical protein